METKEANQKLYETDKISFYEIENKVLLSVHNPRYRSIKNIKVNLCERLKEDAFNMKQDEVCRELLKNEGDLSLLLTLLQNIKEMGFDSSTNRLIFLKVSDEENNQKYVVAEGNRRMLCLKLLFGYFNLQSLDFFLKNNNPYYWNYEKKYEKLRNNYTIKIDTNFRKIENIIQNFKENNQKINYQNKELWFETTNDSAFLWGSIFEKHINGQSLGFKQWSRGSYFLNLINFFSNGFPDSKDTQTIKEYETKLQKQMSKIKPDYKQAQIVYWIVSSDTRIEQEIKDYMLKRPVSALQSQFWIKLIKNILKNIGSNWENYKEQFGFEWKNIVYLDKENSAISKEKLSFIKDLHIKGILTTRSDLTFEEEKELQKNLKIMLGIEKANKILDDTKQEYLNKINQFARKITEEWNKKLKTIALQLKFTLIINNLFDQLWHNSKQNKFAHALASTIRTILELFIIFGYINYKPQNEEEEAIKKNINDWLEKKISDQNLTNEWSKFATSKEMLVFLMGTDDFNTLPLLEKISKYKSKFLKNHLYDKDNKNKIILDNLIECWDKKKLLDNMVHRWHFPTKAFKHLEKCLESIVSFIKELDEKKFHKINQIYDKVENWPKNFKQ